MSDNDPIVGKKLGDYTIESVLGQGGMARVYRGYDARLDRYAAVKVILPTQVASEDMEEYRDRFLREARAIARLNHPNIVGIYQFNDIDSGTVYYMAMHFIEGRDLRQILKEYTRQEKRMSPGNVLRIISDVANALDYAHERGVIHRDIKPSNIMVTADGRAVLTDFGLALNAQEGTIGNTFGSVHYIAPEQAVSSAQAVPQSDLYSLGVIVYEIFAGKLPFEDVSAMSVALKHISDPPPAPSSINPDVSPEIEAVILKALAKEPEERYVTGEEMVAALGKAIEATASPDSMEASDSSVMLQQTIQVAMSPAAPLASDDDDAPTVTDSSQNRPSTLPFSPTDERRKAAAAGSGWNGMWLGIAGVVIVIVIAVALLLSGALGGDGGEDEEATPALAAADRTGTAVALAAVDTDEASATPDDSVTDTAEPEGTAADTDDTPTDVPETETPTATDVPDPTDPPEQVLPVVLTPTDTAEPTVTIVSVAEAGEPEVLLRYDGRSLVLYNRSPSSINIGDLAFVRTTTSGAEIRFDSSEWTTGSLFSMRSRACYQVWTTSFVSIPLDEFPAEICSPRVGFWQTSRAFWVSRTDVTDVVFEVRRGSDVLASCPVSPRFDPVQDNVEALTEYRCYVEIDD